MRTLRYLSKASLLLVLGAIVGCGGNDDDFNFGPETLTGSSQTVNGHTVRTSAIRDNGVITQVSTRVPFELIQNPPETGDGPAGSFVSIPYPNAARNSTFLDHFELHWAPGGHPPEIFEVPHFDIHAYAIGEAAVRNIAPPDTVAPDANRVPAGFIYPGVEAAVPQMGVHAINPAHLEGGFDEIMVLGFWQGNMIFVEPMITQERLLTKQDITLNIDQPEVLGRQTRYPTRFRAVFNEAANAYDFIFDNFVHIAG